MTKCRKISLDYLLKALMTQQSLMSLKKKLKSIKL